MTYRQKLVRPKRKFHGIRIKVPVAGLVAGLMVLAVTAFNGSQPGNVSPREIILIATGVAFHLTHEPDKANPTLTLKRGQAVKLVIRNEEPGRVLHCFTIGGLGVKTSGSLSAGESETLTFTPKKKGSFAYACLMHPSMTGKLVVE